MTYVGDPDLRRLGVAASVRIHTEKAGIVGIVATILQCG
jgi:hypothetical protein